MYLHPGSQGSYVLHTESQRPQIWIKCALWNQLIGIFLNLMGPCNKSYTSLINTINCPLSFPKWIAYSLVPCLFFNYLFIWKIVIIYAHSLVSTQALSFSSIQRFKVSSSTYFPSWIKHFSPSFSTAIKPSTIWISAPRVKACVYQHGDGVRLQCVWISNTMFKGKSWDFKVK